MSTLKATNLQHASATNPAIVLAADGTAAPVVSGINSGPLAGFRNAIIREQSFTSLPLNTLATELIALLGDAKAGRANEAAIQQGIEAVLFYGTFTQEQLAELQAALVAGHLEDIYPMT